ncbi:hypothetical protein LshimejAT787_0400810 [Lyophyllum shimeji]|uniref:Uncharacterized protein n=1 Tax=Lyophyllum shimeji TaxID=47721 RepID=A0A9P3UMQ8_LYOSH|nr:hypothetical protein LshimejAT787_0400810 [Lyophyllum shimeji]
MQVIKYHTVDKAFGLEAVDWDTRDRSAVISSIQAAPPPPPRPTTPPCGPMDLRRSLGPAPTPGTAPTKSFPTGGANGTYWVQEPDPYNSHTADFADGRFRFKGMWAVGDTDVPPAPGNTPRRRAEVWFDKI